LNPQLPVEVSIDHSLAVEVFARGDAAEENMRHEIRRNRERYRFLRWASHSLRGVHINPPGTGIMHTINLEQLATVVQTDEIDGEPWAMPDMMIGTDSHTPMINGVGVLGWGVGGLEAQTVMFGMPAMLRVPDVIGVRLSGALRPGVLATDLALTVTQRLRAIGVSGEFVEFFGPGVSALTAGERAVIANMAPEYGATTGYFPVDEHTLDYLRDTGRSEESIELVRTYMQQAGLWFDPSAQPQYTRTIEIDLDAIGMHVAGPRRPQDLLCFTEVPAALRATERTPAVRDKEMPPFPVAIAAITSCTNTSDPGLLIAAGLVARKARLRGLRVPAWVKTSLGPGSPAAASYLKRAGVLDDLAVLGFDIVGYGCTTCIGNSGPLPEAISRAAGEGAIQPVAMLSGNRNFPGRIHPNLELGFLMSPPLVVAYALAGDAERNLGCEPLGHTPDGLPVMLDELWPTRTEIKACLDQCLEPEDFRRDFKRASRNPLWGRLEAPEAALFPWDPDSTTLRRPPFASLEAGSVLGQYTAYPLMILGNDITTDHISPASAIPPDSLVADFLVERGEDRHDLNVFASRRGNWEVMLRGAFHSKTLANLLAPEAPVAHTLHVPTGAMLPLWEAAQRYCDAGDSVVLMAGERYGTGSSRDWAAKVQRLLGVRAVLALSFERIHRSNLIGMGILPIRLAAGQGPNELNLQPGDRIEVDASPELIRPRCTIAVRVIRTNGDVCKLMAKAAVETKLEVDLLKHGGVMPAILHQSLEAGANRAGVPPIHCRRREPSG
jgi:aconitate hydratase